MGSVRIFRLVESSLVALFLLQAVRVVFAISLSLFNLALEANQVSQALVNAHILIGFAIAVAWFTPRARSMLPGLLGWTSLLVVVARTILLFDLPTVRFYAGIATIALAGVYFTTLLRANRRAWVSGFVVGSTLDQLLRARDSFFDPSVSALPGVFQGQFSASEIWVVIELTLILALLLAGRLARRATRHEPYEPANLTILDGFALGGFLAIELIVLGMPGVVARWAEIPYTGVVPWLLIATFLPLVPGVRTILGHASAVFDNWLRGWVWLLLLLLLVAIGNRLAGVGAAAALIVAQFIAISLLWWIPEESVQYDVEQVGSSTSLALLVCFLLVYAYSFAFEYYRLLSWMQGQGVVVTLVSAGLLALPRLSGREPDPWLVAPIIPQGLVLAFMTPVVILGLLIGGFEPQPGAVGQRDTVRIATYNLNGGYDAGNTFQLELAARTIEASLADIVVLQEVDTGRPVSYMVDESLFLARRLDMYHVFWPTVEHVRGLAVLSRWPIGETSAAYFVGEGEQVGALRAQIAVGTGSGQAVTVIGAQLPVSDENQAIQNLAVLLDLAGDRTPLVLAGDLRVAPDSRLVQQVLAEGFVDPDSLLGIELGYTTPAIDPAFRHDYVLVRDLIPLDARQVDSTASDHRLVVVELGWP
jgi:endonuclease/exonuclease/phosphatase family metal-dependent hydrolase